MAGNVPSYSDLFPVLPLGAAPQKTQGAWAPPKSKKVTKSFVVSGVERRTEQRTGKFGKKETETVFERVMQQTGTHIQTGEPSCRTRACPPIPMRLTGAKPAGRAYERQR